MPTYRIQGPDGSAYDLSAPEGATMEQVEAAAAAHFHAAPPAQTYDPTEGMSGADKLLAGVGKGMMDVGRGVGQAVGLVDRADVAESRRLDEPLMKTTAGKVGAIGGTVAAALPTAFIPGANTMLGAGAIGAGLGTLQPSTSTGETLRNMAISGVLGPAGLAVGRGLGAGVNLVRSSLIEPFTQGGQENIAARALQRFAGGDLRAAEAANLASTAQPPVAGIQPTLAEVARNPGLAQLERTLRNNPDVGPAITDRLQANRGTLVQTLRDLAGDEGQMQAARTARSNAAGPLYDAAMPQTVAPDEAMQALLQRPSARSAIGRAQQLANEGGQQIVIGRDIPPSTVETGILDAAGRPVTRDVPGESAAVTGRGLHYLKMAMDDMLTPGNPQGIVGNEARAVGNTRGDLVSAIESAIPEYGQARAAYAAGSAPINQMQIGQHLLDRIQPALADFGADSRTTGATYAKALRDGDATAARATGLPNATMEGVLTPVQLANVNGVAEQLARRANADELGRAVGSPTAQNLVSQNILRQVLGPLGLPESIAEHSLAKTILTPLQMIARAGAEPAVLSRLGRAALDPADAATLLTRQTDSPLGAAALNRLPYVNAALRAGEAGTTIDPRDAAAYQAGTATLAQVARLEAAAQSRDRGRPNAP